MTVELEDIFDTDRVTSWFHYIPLFFYFPIGLCLAVIRFFIGINAFFLTVIFAKLPAVRRFLLRIMCIVLGFIVFVEDAENYSNKVKIIVSNHVTKFDHLAMNLIISTIVPSVWELPPYLTWILGYTDFGSSQGRLVLIHNVREFMKDSSTPLLIFPEGTTTNGKKGLLKFNSWPFLLDEAIQPARIKVARPKLMNIAFSVLGSRWWSDLFWFLFVPYTTFRIKFLPVAEKQNTESAEMFCDKVQRQICRELGLEASTFTSADKVEYSKYILKEDGRR